MIDHSTGKEVLVPRRKAQTNKFKRCMDALPPAEIAMAWLGGGTMPELGGKEKRCGVNSMARHFGLG